MNEADALELLQYALQTLMYVSAPLVLTAMLVGTLIAFLQALTQIQEMTLTFIPKILLVLMISSVSAPFIASQMGQFATFSFSRISEGFGN